MHTRFGLFILAGFAAVAGIVGVVVYMLVCGGCTWDDVMKAFWVVGVPVFVYLFWRTYIRT